MVWQQTPYTLPLLLSGGLLTSFSVYLWWIGRGQQSHGTILGSLLMLVGAEWVFTYALQLSATTLSGKLFWLRFEFVGVVLLPLIWFGYVLWYTGRDRWFTPRVFGSLGVFAVGFLILLVTNDAHHLVYQEFQLTTIDSLVILDTTYGPAFGLYMIYANGLLLATLGLLASTFVHTRGVFRWQISVLFIFALVPGIAGILYVTENNPLPGLNIAALSNIVTAFAGGISLIRFKWMDVTPVARDTTFDAMNEVVVVVDPAHRIVDLNASAGLLFGDPRDEIIGTPATEYIPELDAMLSDPDPPDRQELTVSAGADERVFEVTISPIKDVPGDETGYTILLHDITARKQAEQQVQQQSTRLTQLHSVAQKLAAAHTTDEVYDLAVSGAGELLACDDVRISAVENEYFVPQASLNGDLSETCSPMPIDAGYAGYSYSKGSIEIIDDMTHTRSAAADTSESDPPSAHSVPLSIPNADTTTNEETPTHDAEYRSLLSAPVGEYGVLQAFDTGPGAFDDQDRQIIDLLLSHVETALERVAVEEELRAERDRLDEFASVVSHDLRNPLNVADGRVRLAADELDGENEHLEATKRALTKMADLIEDMLTLSREGRTIGETESVHLDSIVKQAWSSVETKNASLTIADSLPAVEADPARLRELFENLFRNAVEHGGADVTVTVGTLENGFYLADDGPGIPQDERSSVFESGYSTAANGTGFGLAIVEQIADAHGWDVALHESQEGGARFEFTEQESVYDRATPDQPTGES
ncbi:histidine kinase N-terminal 7TM domain-containing protein [Natronomonas gomsonensis]|uniref:histidine kinase N-terminal 7TM domain-containing protein n=1 Tax=Natronomonas gomsonensis TaxID=1046043 RepID=UPI0020CA2C8A|nr:histidine kinase N-terminal 7TM domain-containing protein [Natronomonas gomsonensis]